MPKRVIDFDAMWGSDKLASCAEWAQAEYAWLYGLADASGCFELTNLRVIWGRVAAIRRNLSLERLEQIFHEFHDKGLLFVWEENGKRYGHWTGSDVPGRLPAPSWRIRLERLAPPVPKQQFAEFMSRFSRGRAASPGGGFFGEALPGADRGSVHYAGSLNAEKCESRASGVKTPDDDESDLSCLKARPTKMENSSCNAFSVKTLPGIEGLNDGLEAAQGKDWKWNQNQKREVFAGRAQTEEEHCGSQNLGNAKEKSKQQPSLPNSDSKSEIQRPGPLNETDARPELNQFSGGLPFGTQGKQVGSAPSVRAVAAGSVGSAPSGYHRSTGNSFRERDKSLAVARELMVGQGPRCGPVRVKPEALERIRAREGSRSP
jgi:hypothetical protein